MDSWLDDTDKNFGPDLPLLFKMHEIWSVDCQEIVKIATRCEILRLKCIKFNFAGALPQTPLMGSLYSAPSDPIAGLKGSTSKGRKGTRRKGEGKGKWRGRERKE